jgi:branched-chain amino acid transport system substrate-binding protein
LRAALRAGAERLWHDSFNRQIENVGGSDSEVIAQKGDDNIFMTTFTPDVGMAKFVRWLVEVLKAEKVAVVWVNDTSGKGGRDMVLQSMKERGQTPVADISIEVQQTDFTPELDNLRASGAAHVMVYGRPETSARFMVQFRKAGLPAQPVGETTLCAPATIALGGASVNGAQCHVGMVATAAPLPRWAIMPQIGDMVRRFREKYGRMPDPDALKGYLGVHMLKVSVLRARDWDAGKVRACLHKNLFSTLQEPSLLVDVYVNATGSLDRPSFIVEVKDGKPVVTGVAGMLGQQQYKPRACQ